MNTTKEQSKGQPEQDSSPISFEKEDFDWLNMTPVGRELGSKDYDRLLAHDNLVYAGSKSESCFACSLSFLRR